MSDIAQQPAAAPSAPAPDQPAPAPDRPAQAAAAGIGVLLVNLGTPEATDANSVRRYLREFLADKRVVEETGFVWELVLNGFILPFRPRRKGRDYARIWNHEKNESPLKTITRSQAEKLASMLEPLGGQAGGQVGGQVGGRITVDWGMRYGEPAMASRLKALAERGCDRILVVPLYPQYAAPTTATVCDEAFRALMKMRRQPALRVAPPWFDDPVYIHALTSTLENELARLPFRPDVILASYHGMPKAYVDKGDPYYGQCVETTRLMRERLKLDETKLRMTFQSRFGRAPWLQPYTDATVKSLARQGIKNLAVVTPGFAADCLETLEEIAVENARIFKRAGGENFVHIPCLNDSERGMLVIRTVVQRELKGWV
ncbi:MAG TPA: ferrochelatase [Xanthobacteraceae bacterium]|nr:ferrochelatase [Xanthobacteraceae bacterium]